MYVFKNLIKKEKNNKYYKNINLLKFNKIK